MAIWSSFQFCSFVLYITASVTLENILDEWQKKKKKKVIQAHYNFLLIRGKEIASL